ncbi:leucyl/phenylalanyl-tRNA--protein transferase [Flavobacterium sp. CS20]|jgi:leucyl/phenylalanyl-tRNA--protein transferase|uniref:leucyl/phenylalanyl-tRNA--protein transferase n=1 Tax=Flavobacterium sp. CS20 TaxID=2775246 RepID=UPI001B3A637A|nr:leucyl/phenylalanyl-tRNA--protein transferase [Flavobacterium sp. CS20]QTY26931.1 leucyl/phenylalanyl-tRNA--protein transferase [Flavobacterium sp. CS20]
MVFLTSELWFPHPQNADESGVLAVGGDLSAERLMLAYRNGIFPWYNENEPILWWSPDQRMVLFPEKLHISKSMRPLLNQNKFKVTFNQAFEKVIAACATTPREGQDGTWLSDEMIKAYTNLHKKGFAHSVETWQDDELVGGLYGVYLKSCGVFCGESMFAHQSNASKFAFIKMVEHYKTLGLKLVDCQIYTPHLERLGAELIDRDEFLKVLRKN